MAMAKYTAALYRMHTKLLPFYLRFK